MTRSQIEKSFRRRGFSCGSWIDPPGQVWPNFIHSSDELVHVVDGRLELDIEGDLVRLGPGEEAVIPAGRRHSVRNSSHTITRWLYGYRV